MCIGALEGKGAHALRKVARAGSIAAAAARSAECTRFPVLRSRCQHRDDVRVQVTEVQDACNLTNTVSATIDHTCGGTNGATFPHADRDRTWSDTLLESVQAAQQAARAGSGLRVTNARLDSCHRQRLLWHSTRSRFARRAQRGERSACLHGVAQRRARAVQLQTADGTGNECSLTHGCPHDFLQRRTPHVNCSALQCWLAKGLPGRDKDDSTLERVLRDLLITSSLSLHRHWDYRLQR